MAEEQSDPFTETGDAIFAALLNYTPFANAFLPGNRGGQDERGLLKATISRAPADFPFVTVTQAGFGAVPAGRNSRTVNATQTYLIQLATDDMTTITVNRVKWLAFLALAIADQSFGLPFIREWVVSNAAEGQANLTPAPAPTAAAPRGQAWVALFFVTVEMYWERAALLA